MTGRELRLQRMAVGVKQKEIAAALDRSATLICLIEKGRLPVPAGFARRYLAALRRVQRGRVRTSRSLGPLVSLMSFLDGKRTEAEA